MQKKLIHLTSFIFLFVLASCSMEEKDTRLVCDCEYSTWDNGFQKFDGCLSQKNEAEVFDNKSLVFNESKEFFQFNGGLMGSQFTTFTDNEIVYRFEGDMQRTTRMFDRVNLTMVEALQDRDVNYLDSVSGVKIYEDNYRYHYQCRVVEGV